MQDSEDIRVSPLLAEQALAEALEAIAYQGAGARIDRIVDAVIVGYREMEDGHDRGPMLAQIEEGRRALHEYAKAKAGRHLARLPVLLAMLGEATKGEREVLGGAS